MREFLLVVLAQVHGFALSLKGVLYAVHVCRLLEGEQVEFGHSRAHQLDLLVLLLEDLFNHIKQVVAHFGLH